MTTITVDFAKPPLAEQEVRLQREDCIVSIWLPASLDAVSAVLTALAKAGFDWHEPPAAPGDPRREPAQAPE